MSEADLERARDALYAADPAEFVARRKQLAADLRAAGSKEGAKALLSARRPSTSAWAMNQLARQNPELVEQLLETGRALLATQTRAFAGNRDGMRDAMRAHQASIEAATNAALAILGSRANDAFRNEIVATLRAASTDEEVGRTLQLGRVVREVEADLGFPDGAGLMVADLPAPERAPRKAAPPTPPKATAAAPASNSRTALRAVPDAQPDPEDDARVEAHRRAVDAAAAAEDAVASAQERVEELQQDLEIARQELKDARARLKRAAAHERKLDGRV